MRHRTGSSIMAQPEVDFVSTHSCHWSVATALFIALAIIHADLATVVEGAGGRQFQRQYGLNKNRNDRIVPSSASSSSKGVGSLSSGPKAAPPIGLDQQSPPKLMLVPDNSETKKDPLLAGRAKPARLKSKYEYVTEEDAMVKTRHFLKNQNELQSKREKNLRYLNIHANLLVENKFQTKLVDELKKVKDETEHILDLGGGNRRHMGRKRRSAKSMEEEKDETIEKKEKSMGKREPSGQRGETTMVGDSISAESKAEKGKEVGQKGHPGYERATTSREGEKAIYAHSPETTDKNMFDGERDDGPVNGGKDNARILQRERRGVPPWKDYLYNLPTNERGKYHHVKNPGTQGENEGFKDHKESPKYQIHDKEQVVALSPEEEADFRQNLENLLQELDTEKENFEKTEERKIEDFEGRKNLYLDHAEQMAAKTRGPNSDSAFLEEVTDIIQAAQLQNAIAREKTIVSNIIGNSNQPRRPIFTGFEGNHRVQIPTSTLSNEIKTNVGWNHYGNEIPTYHTKSNHEDGENDLTIYRNPRRKLIPTMEINKLNGENSNICPVVDNFVRGCSQLRGSGDFKIIFYNYCSQHQMCYRCGIASNKGREECDNKFVDAVTKVCGMDSVACLANADFFLRQLQRDVFYFYPFPLSGGAKCDQKCIQNFIHF